VVEGFCLDLGCGAGYGSYLLSYFCDRIVAVDQEKEALKEARALYQRPNLEFRELDLEKIRLKDEFESPDFVIAFEFLEHLDHPEVLIDQVRDLLKDTGWFILSLPCASESGYHKHTYHNLSDMKGLLDRGFEKVDIFFQFDQWIMPYSMKNLFKDPTAILFTLRK